MKLDLRFPKQGAGERGRQAKSLVDVFRARADAQSEQVAFTFLVDGERQTKQLTYGQLDQRARALAVRLRHTCEPGSRALLMYDAGLDYLVALAGCLYAGVVAVPVFPPDPLRVARTLPRLRSVMQDADPAIILGDASSLAWVAPLLGDAWAGERLFATDHLDESLADEWSNPELTRQTLALLQYTSGSTGEPKGVMLRHGNVLENLNQIESSIDIDDAVVVTWLPAYHDMGLIGGLLQCWYSGRHNVLLSPLMFFQRPMRWLEAIASYRATTAGAPDFAYDLCVRKSMPEERDELDLSSWQIALSGAEPVRAETIDRFVAAFAGSGVRREIFCPCYGLAEATLLVACAEVGSAPQVGNFDGPRLAEGHAVRSQPGSPEGRSLVSSGHTPVDQYLGIVDPISRERLADGRVGEIWTRGANVAAGYWNRPEESASVFQAFTADGAGPYLRTGDLGFVDQGELYPSGRLKDVIIVQGRNYYPPDIEQSIEGCHPAVKPYACAVFGLDEQGREAVVVVQEVLRPKHHDLDEVARQVRQAVLAAHDLGVDHVVLIKQGSIPKTTSGKIQRHACREQMLSGDLRIVHHWHAFSDRAAASPAAPFIAPRSATETVLADAWSDVLGVERVGIHDNFFDLGGTSLLVTQLVNRLARRWNLTFTLEDLFGRPTIAELALWIDAQVEQQDRSEQAFLAMLEELSDEEAAERLNGHHASDNSPSCRCGTADRHAASNTSNSTTSARMNGRVDTHS